MSANILVAFYSRDGSVEKLGCAIAEGAESVGATVRLRRAREHVDASVMDLVPGWRERAERMNAAYEAPTLADAEWADGIVLGTPTRFGLPSSELQAYLETLGALWLGRRLLNKAGSAFASTSTNHGGAETTIQALYPPLVHLGLVIVPPGYGDNVMFKAGTPYGANSVSHAPARTPPTEDDLAAARYQGRRVAEVARALKGLRDIS